MVASVCIRMVSDTLAMGWLRDISGGIADIGFRIGSFAYPESVLFFLFLVAFDFLFVRE